MGRSPHEPPVGAPPGTVWFGGPIDRFKISLRIIGTNLDPADITAKLGVKPTRSEAKGRPIESPDGTTRTPQRGMWMLTLESAECDADFDDAIKILLERLTADLEVWKYLTDNYRVDLFCGIFLETNNRGFGIPADVTRMLADRNLDLGFDLYFR